RLQHRMVLNPGDLRPWAPLKAAFPFLAATSTMIAARQDVPTTWKPVSDHGPTSLASTSQGDGRLPVCHAGRCRRRLAGGRGRDGNPVQGS
ncbi:MAG: hypothetical protein OXI66_19450, partial [Boseongicola sp.]|nr:hypothetical protein [Boseongicola sp.]